MIRKITGYIIGAVALGIIVWDVYAYTHEDNSSVSVVITDWSRFHPTIALFAGILMGHWFWPAQGSDD